ncbi:hypothetical protein AsAng_0003090 [Aureispira anguillae]|uniref:Uncharacterized protein n=1 Tax=Aureispira anguillae TaxID=2864201 RepID=A0A915VKH5_9BACT|nr:hypothetical protein AsAng_0003090 [Aureispira anguillae]
MFIKKLRILASIFNFKKIILSQIVFHIKFNFNKKQVYQNLNFLLIFIKLTQLRHSSGYQHTIFSEKFSPSDSIIYNFDETNRSHLK